MRLFAHNLLSSSNAIEADIRNYVNIEAYPKFERLFFYRFNLLHHRLHWTPCQILQNHRI